jgi:hypothetical protein
MENRNPLPNDGILSNQQRDYNSDPDNDSFLPSESGSGSSTSYESDRYMPELGTNNVFNDDQEPNLPPPPLPPENNDSEIPNPTDSTPADEYTDFTPTPVENNLGATQFSIFNPSSNQYINDDDKALKTPLTNAGYNLLKTIGIVSGLGLSAFAGIGYGISLIIPELHTLLTTLSILQFGALFLGLEFLIISATLIALNYMNNKNETVDLSSNESQIIQTTL